MKGDMLLKHAAAVFANRREQYGDAPELFDRIARRWSLTLGIDIAPSQVALCMIDVKIARLAHTPNHLDSIGDIAGYAACLSEVVR